MLVGLLGLVRLAGCVEFIRKEFTDPMVWTGEAWEPITTSWVPLEEKVKWTVTFYVPNNSGETLHGAVLEDHFGAELDQAVPDSYNASQGTVSFVYSSERARQRSHLY